MNDFIFYSIPVILILAAIIYTTVYYYKKWKTKETEKKVHSILSDSYTSDYLNSLNGTDMKRAVELGLKSRCYRMQIEKLSYDARHKLAFGFLELTIAETGKMKTETKTTIEDLKEIFQNVTYMNLEWDPVRSENE